MHLKILFVLFALITSTSALSQEVIKMHDGSIVRCQNLVDVTQNLSRAIYRTLKTDIHEEGVVLTVEFLKCVQGLERYGFIRDDQFSERLVSFKNRTIKISRKTPIVIVTKNDSRVIAQKELNRRGNNTYTAFLPVTKSMADRTSKGEYFIEYNIRMHETVKDVESGAIIDSGDKFLGTFRLKF